MLTGAWATNPFWTGAARVALQFLWQASALTATLLLLERLLRPAAADVRYRRTLATLVAVALAPIWTAVGLMAWNASTSLEATPAPSTVGDEFASSSTLGRRSGRSDTLFPRHGADAPAPLPIFAERDAGTDWNEAFAVYAAARPENAVEDASSAAFPVMDPGLGSSEEAPFAAVAAPSAEESVRLSELSVPRWLLPLCVGFWIAGSSFLLVRLLAGFWIVRRWTERAAVLTGEGLELAQRLAEQMGLKSLPPIFASSAVAEPMAVGVLRPRIFLPAEWTGLPAGGIEAVLAHELSHVRRGDLRVNFLQRLIEAVWFFHPAVWWLTRRVRADRELCCDREAVETTGRPLEYATALEFVAKRAWAALRPGEATGMGEESMAILKRVKAVLGAPAGPSPTPWWWIGTLSVAIPAGLWLGSVSLVPARADDEKPPAAREQPKEGERPAPPREGDRPAPPREAGPRDGGPREGGDRNPPPREGDRRRDGDRGPAPGDRGPGPGDRGRGDRGPGPGDRGPGDRGPGPGGPRERGPGDRGPGDRGPGPGGPGHVPPHEELMHMIRELHHEIAELRKEVRELREERGRGPGAGGPREGFRGPRDGFVPPRDGDRGPDGPRPDFNRRDGGPRPEGGPRPDGPRREREGGPRPPEGDRRPPDGERRPDGPPRDGERKPVPPEQPRGDGERKPALPDQPKPDGERKPTR